MMSDSGPVVTSLTTQLAGMRGLMARSNGRILNYRFTSNFNEGLTVMRYFMSTPRARRDDRYGLGDSRLGFQLVVLVDVAQDVIIRETRLREAIVV